METNTVKLQASSLFLLMFMALNSAVTDSAAC